VAEPDPRIATFLAQLERRGMPRERLAELADHLQCSCAQKRDAGLLADAAVTAALAELGDVAAVTIEYRKETLMHPLQKLLGLVFAVCAILVAIQLGGGHVEIYLSEFAIVPALVVGGVTLGGLVASFGMRRVGQLVAVATLGRSAETDDIAVLQQVCRRGQRLAWTGCLLVLTFSAMHICSVLDSPHLIGPGIAWALVAVVYAALLADLGFGSAERWVAQQAA
jgi:hypothetical protein